MCFYPLQLLYLIGAQMIAFLDSGSSSDWFLSPIDVDLAVFDSWKYPFSPHWCCHPSQPQGFSVLHLWLLSPTLKVPAACNKAGPHLHYLVILIQLSNNTQTNTHTSTWWPQTVEAVVVVSRLFLLFGSIAPGMYRQIMVLKSPEIIPLHIATWIHN